MTQQKGASVRRQILRRLEDERWDRRLQHKAFKKAVNASKSVPVGVRRRLLRGKTPAKAPRVDLTVPATLDLRKERDVLCNFVNEVRTVVRSGKRVLLRFDEVSKIRTSALVYFLSQIHKLRLEHGSSCINGTYPDSEAVERLLAESGFFKLLNVRTRERVQKPNPKMRYIQFKSDQRVASGRIKEVREEILRNDFTMPPDVRRRIFRAMSEAMINVGHHAYLKKSFISSEAARELHGRWWFLASVLVPSNLFTLVFADCGVGIPKTLHRRYTVEKIREVLSLLPGFRADDGQMIEAAMVLGRTRTEKDNRGKGLLDLMKLIDLVGDGKMTIYSRQGVVTYTATATKHENLRTSIEGTLIEWSLPLDKALVALTPDGTDEAQAEN